jgi:hypothetical protein
MGTFLCKQVSGRTEILSEIFWSQVVVMAGLRNNGSYIIERLIGTKNAVIFNL